MITWQIINRAIIYSKQMVAQPEEVVQPRRKAGFRFCPRNSFHQWIKI